MVVPDATRKASLSEVLPVVIERLQRAGVTIEVFPLVIDREERRDGEWVTALGYAKLEGKSWGICVGSIGVRYIPNVRKGLRGRASGASSLLAKCPR